MDQQTSQQRRVYGRPFPPGTSGCPGGGRITKQRLAAELAAELGGDLSVMERTLLDQAVGLIVMSKRERDPVTRVRIAGRVDRILTKLRKAREQPLQPAEADVGDLQAYISAAEGPS